MEQVVGMHRRMFELLVVESMAVDLPPILDYVLVILPEQAHLPGQDLIYLQAFMADDLMGMDQRLL